MYSTILALHSLVRWFVLISLLFSIFRAYTGWLSKKNFSHFDNSVRHWTATIAHIQLVLGLWLYFISPIIVNTRDSGVLFTQHAPFTFGF